VERLLVAAVVVVIATVVAVLVERRRPDPPTQAGWTVPAQLDRDDFERPSTPWLVAVFTSATCSTCAAASQKAAVLASDDVVVQEIEVAAQRELHDRYRIEAVPLILLADADGVVRKSFAGPPSATDLWAAVAEARQTTEGGGPASG
jgi:hypothetical protein